MFHMFERMNQPQVTDGQFAAIAQGRSSIMFYHVLSTEWCQCFSHTPVRVARCGDVKLGTLKGNQTQGIAFSVSVKAE
jgi:hypothetical protein